MVGGADVPDEPASVVGVCDAWLRNPELVRQPQVLPCPLDGVRVVMQLGNAICDRGAGQRFAERSVYKNSRTFSMARK